MDKVPFQKFHGFGNDYIVVTNEGIAPVSNVSEFAKAICHRNTGAGSDGIALLEKMEDGDVSDFSCRIINPDGSEAGFSGNGTRCAVAYLYREGLWIEKTLRLKTHSGIKNYEFLRNENNAYWYLAELGKPVFEHEKIPFHKLANGQDRIEFRGDVIVDKSSKAQLPYLPLNVGNPVCAVFVEDFELHWRTIGAAIERHACFPERTNVVFIRPFNESNIQVKIWERGAGETLSSGTCSIAAAVASAFTERTIRTVNVHADGGMTKAVWREDDEMLITGSAEYIYSGEWPLGDGNDENK